AKYALHQEQYASGQTSQLNKHSSASAATNKNPNKTNKASNGKAASPSCLLSNNNNNNDMNIINNNNNEQQQPCLSPSMQKAEDEAEQASAIVNQLSPALSNISHGDGQTS